MSEEFNPLDFHRAGELMPEQGPVKPWQQITPQEFAAMSEREKRELARTILEEAFGPPANEHRRKIIEAILNANYGPQKVERALDS